MKMLFTSACFALAMFLVPSPAQAQIFYKAPDFSAPPLTALDPVFDLAMPGATPTEISAVITWHLRSALNLAALQCGFQPMLRTNESYGALLVNHVDELSAAYKTVFGYFKRTKKTLGLAEKAFDSFGTRTISHYSTVGGQLGFCHIASVIGHEAKYVPRGSLRSFAQTYVPWLRNAQKPSREEQFFPPYIPRSLTLYPSTDRACWTSKGEYLLSCPLTR
jgi:hypothetical protein